jgi:hypothetical protein
MRSAAAASSDASLRNTAPTAVDGCEAPSTAVRVRFLWPYASRPGASMPGMGDGGNPAELLPEESAMSKSKDTGKDNKKKPAKSLMEKRAAKREKKASRVFRV